MSRHYPDRGSAPGCCSKFPTWHDQSEPLPTSISVMTRHQGVIGLLHYEKPCDIVFMKMKITWFYRRKTISGLYLKGNNYSDLVFQTCTIFLKWVGSLLVTWPNVIFFKIMNYLFLNTNFALKLQGKCWKDNVVTFTAHLSVAIKHLTIQAKSSLAAMLEGKSMPSNVAANANHTTLLKNQSAT